MMKDLYISAHEQLIETYLEQRPDADRDEAYDKTADRAYDKMKDIYADMIDQAKQRAKDSGNWPPRKG